MEAAGVQVRAPFPPTTSVSEADQLSTTSAPIEDQYSDDEFEDATSDNLEGVDLSVAFVDCEAAIKKFFCNDVQGAMNLMLPHAGTSLYHSLGAAIFAFIPAILTFDQNKIMEASAAIKNCIIICNRNRKHRGIVETLGSLMRKPNYTLYSDKEAHAELCFAEALLLQAALSVIEGEDLAGFIKGALKVRTCYSSYKHCGHIFEAKPWESEEARIHFKSGVRLGRATFNLMISMLPLKFVTVLEIAGYTGNRNFGLTELQRGAEAPGLRRVLCGLTLLAFNLAVQPYVGGQCNYKICKDILDDSLQLFPQSVWFLVFKARYELVQGNLDDAVQIYKDTSDIDHKNFQEFRHLCYWELMWISALKLDYRASSEYASYLMEQSVWSRTTYMYVKATMLMQLGDEATQSDHTEVQRLVRDAASFKMRIAGKSVPMEKFAIKRCARYHVQQEKLILPALELLCIWNLLPMLKKNLPILQNMLKSIESAREAMLRGPRDWMDRYVGDNTALLHFMQGCVLAVMQLPRQAIQHFQEAAALKREIREDHFLVPYAITEMAMCYYHLDDFAKCKECLMEARRKYSGYALESRLHFRVHARHQMLRTDFNVL